MREGDVLVRLDTRQEQAQLAAAEAQRELARAQLRADAGAARTSGSSRRRSSTARPPSSGRRTRSVGEIRATIERKTIRAPFSGVLGIRQVNLGQYLAGGDAVVSLQSLNPIYVNFGVPQQAAGQMRVGRTRAHHDRRRWRASTFAGRVTAIDSIVDEATRNIQVQATLANPDGKLRPGCSCRPRSRSAPASTVVALPASAISYAPYGDSVFVVADMKDAERARPIAACASSSSSSARARGDQVAVVSGVKPGDEVVTSGVFKLRNGAAVPVNNKVQPAQQPGAQAGEQLMKFTDLFVKRPVLAIVVNLVILIAGPAVDPRAERPAVPAQRHRRRHGHDRRTSARTPISCAASSRRRSSA